ncbi:metal ABC transporter solute-binding protein, Zn/Mn family [Actinophytocola sp. NPDC049390]|uniref:metal ABC transporter solute-binding protein, Zn/Mn family n=1 Tax=Actinophytocola sp. NPDC049390 TaxID=3363894 RepID=UPI0037B9F6B8
MRSALPLAVAAVAVLAAGCGGDTGGDAAADGKIAVVASTNVWGSVVEAVGGDNVSVRSLINDSKGDPHSYADKPEDATLLTEAKLVVYNGGGYDDFFTKLVDAAGADAKQVVAYDVSGLPDGENEHVWYDFGTAKKVADKVAAELGAIDPDNKTTYEDNAKAFDGELDELAATADAIPDGKVVATEPVAKYLLDVAGMTDATPTDFSEAIEEETDPPVAAVADTMDLVSGKQVVALVNNEQTETNVTDQLNDAAKSAGVPIVNVSETLPPGVTDYVEWMTKQVDALAGAVA